jgi:hypothetical protein
LLLWIRITKVHLDLLDIVTWIGCHAVWVPYVHLYLFSLNSVLFAVAKYSYAAVWSPGVWASVGKRRHSLMAMVATIARPTPDRPVLMQHDDERCLFARWDTLSMAIQGQDSIGWR